jgi:hypothetical protein
MLLDDHLFLNGHDPYKEYDANFHRDCSFPHHKPLQVFHNTIWNIEKILITHVADLSNFIFILV